ncbi:MAG: hypothetical protein WC749_02015 [Dehalococcoidia bacterium]
MTLTDRELEEWVAEKVMGWIWSQEHEMWVLDSERDADGRLTFACPDELNWVNDDPDELGHQGPWHPDTDLNQAFMVVERMRELGWKVVMGNNLDRSYFADFRQLSYPVPMDNFYAEASNPALAILLAAHATGEGQEANPSP